MELRYYINILDDGSVVTKDGEYLGVCSFDEEDHPWFTPEGETQPLFFDIGVPLICRKIENWHRTNNGEIVEPTVYWS